MNDEADRRLSAALRAQASGLGTGSLNTGSLNTGSLSTGVPGGSASHARQAPQLPVGHESPQARRGLPGWAVLAVAVLLGAVAGGLAGVISVW